MHLRCEIMCEVHIQWRFMQGKCTQWKYKKKTGACDFCMFFSQTVRVQAACLNMKRVVHINFMFVHVQAEHSNGKSERRAQILRKEHSSHFNLFHSDLLLSYNNFIVFPPWIAKNQILNSLFFLFLFYSYTHFPFFIFYLFTYLFFCLNFFLL